MKLTPPKNENYAATIVEVRNIVDLPKSDRIVGVPIFGFQAITGKADTKVGDLRVLFTAETQLSTPYAAANNLHRHSDRNNDPGVVGYLEDTRRVKALRLRGNVSNALLMPLSSLAFTGADVSQLKAGDVFDELNGVEICRKYQLRVPGARGVAGAKTPKSLQRVDEMQFPKHFDTANYFRNADRIALTDRVSVTQKLHGTSIRVGHVLVKRKLSWLEKIAKRLGVKVQETEHDYIFGSRNVVKDPRNPFNTNGDFYSTDIYSEIGGRLRGLIPKGYMIFGELVGWAGETPIQPGFTYGIPAGMAELHVYRITQINESGLSRDLPWDQVKEFCRDAGIKHVPQLWEGVGFEDYVHTFLDCKLADRFPEALPVDVVDEGVCVRKDGVIPTVLKAKSPLFFELESKQLDQGVADMESKG